MMNSSKEAAERLLEEARKEAAFSAQLRCLGVVVDLSASDSGKVVIRDELDRVDGIAAQVDEIVAEGACKLSIAAPLRGRFQFAEGQLYGRAVAACTPAFINRAPTMTMFHSCVSR